MSGLSFSIHIGKWAKPKVWFNKQSWYINTGFIAFQLWFLDLEVFIHNLVEDTKP